MPDLTVQIDGARVSLLDCYWIQSARCGCIVALTTTAKVRKFLATPEQAHAHMVPSKRERDDDNRRGYTWAAVTKDRYHAEIGTQWMCDQHRTGGAS